MKKTLTNLTINCVVSVKYNLAYSVNTNDCFNNFTEEFIYEIL